MRAPPDSAKQINGVLVLIAKLHAVTIAWPTNMPIDPPINPKSIAVTIAFWPSIVPLQVQLLRVNLLFPVLVTDRSIFSIFKLKWITFCFRKFYDCVFIENDIEAAAGTLWLL